MRLEGLLKYNPVLLALIASTGMSSKERDIYERRKREDRR